MDRTTSENIYLVPGSNLQICFVNEHHQANENDKIKNDEQNEDILAKQQRLKVSF